ncbi:unnamed protein product, partial [Pelagomonas calceolata]
PEPQRPRVELVDGAPALGLHPFPDRDRCGEVGVADLRDRRAPLPVEALVPALPEGVVEHHPHEAVVEADRPLLLFGARRERDLREARILRHQLVARLRRRCRGVGPRALRPRLRGRLDEVAVALGQDDVRAAHAPVEHPAVPLLFREDIVHAELRRRRVPALLRVVLGLLDEELGALRRVEALVAQPGRHLDLRRHRRALHRRTVDEAPCLVGVEAGVVVRGQCVAVAFPHARGAVGAQVEASVFQPLEHEPRFRALVLQPLRVESFGRGFKVREGQEGHHFACCQSVVTSRVQPKKLLCQQRCYHLTSPAATQMQACSSVPTHVRHSTRRLRRQQVLRDA